MTQSKLHVWTHCLPIGSHKATQREAQGAHGEQSQARGVRHEEDQAPQHSHAVGGHQRPPIAEGIGHMRWTQYHCNSILGTRRQFLV